jgi:hypothetical protein
VTAQLQVINIIIIIMTTGITGPKTRILKQMKSMTPHGITGLEMVKQ